MHLLFRLWPHTGAEACRRGLAGHSRPPARPREVPLQRPAAGWGGGSSPAAGAERAGAEQGGDLIESEQHKWTFTIVTRKPFRAEDPVWTNESVMK